MQSSPQENRGSFSTGNLPQDQFCRVACLKYNRKHRSKQKEKGPLPTFLACRREWIAVAKWSSGLCCLKSVSTRVHWFLWLFSLLSDMPGLPAGQQCWRKQASGVYRHLYWLCSIPMLGRCSLGLHRQALSFLLTGITGLQNRLSGMLHCFNSV